MVCAPKPALSVEVFPWQCPSWPSSADPCLLSLEEARFACKKKHLLLLTSSYWRGISISV